MRFLVDIDDTISNFGEILINELNQIYHTSFTKEDMNNWEWLRNNFKNPWFPTEYKTFWDKVSIDKNAINCLENLVQKGEEVYLVTASFPNDCLGYKIRKTLENFNEKYINESNVIVCYDKSLIKGDIRIDDGIHNFCDDSLNILLTQPWNKNCNEKKSDSDILIIRKNNWQEISKLFNRYYKF